MSSIDLDSARCVDEYFAILANIMKNTYLAYSFEEIDASLPELNSALSTDDPNDQENLPTIVVPPRLGRNMFNLPMQQPPGVRRNPLLAQVMHRKEPGGRGYRINKSFAIDANKPFFRELMTVVEGKNLISLCVQQNNFRFAGLDTFLRSTTTLRVLKIDLIVIPGTMESQRFHDLMRGLKKNTSVVVLNFRLFLDLATVMTEVASLIEENKSLRIIDASVLK